MKSKLFKDRTEQARTSTGRWVMILPDNGDGRMIYDQLQDAYIGRISGQ